MEAWRSTRLRPRPRPRSFLLPPLHTPPQIVRRRVLTCYFRRGTQPAIAPTCHATIG
jgi:hypothetical protein